MHILEPFRVAFGALLANKLRALLTMLGIIIGVSAVIGILAIGNGLASYFEIELNKFGVGVFYIYPGIDSNKANATQTPQLTSADADAITQPGVAPAVKAVAIEFSGAGTVSAGKDRYTYPIRGVTTSHFSINSTDLGVGRYFTANEDRDRARVALLGNKVAEALFGSIANAVGQRITVNGVGFEVVGVLVTKPNQANTTASDPGKDVYVPYQTARSRLFRNAISSRIDVTTVTVQAQSREQVNAAITQVAMLLRERHRLTYQDNDFSIINLEQIATQVNAILLSFNAFLSIIAGIALLVGGIGIMNIMLVSVTERTREIGLRKAVGARRSDILLQFLIEAIVLSLIGGAIGIGIGFAMSSVGTLVLETVFSTPGARASVSLFSVILATSLATGVGVCFGFFPALRAARLHPIQALRYE
jgi:putative ABC transport system permease protein